MADKFDISEHIRVEALGNRIGQLTTDGLFVNGIEYNELDYTITDPNAPERIVYSMSPTIVDGDITGVEIGTYSGISIDFRYTNPQTSRNSTYSVYMIRSSTDNLTIDMDPVTEGELLGTYGYYATTGTNIGTFTLEESFVAGNDYFLFYITGAYIAPSKALAGKKLLAAYTYNITGSIGGANTTNNYYAPWHTNDLRKFTISNETLILPRAPINSTTNDYKLYFNGNFAVDCTMTPGNIPSSYDSADFTWKWLEGVNTLELYRADATYGVDSPLTTLNVDFGYTANYKYPTYENPVIVRKKSSNTLEILWQMWNEHEGQTQYPSGTLGDTTLIDIYGSDQTINLAKTEEYATNYIYENAFSYRIAKAVISGLDADNTSYLVELYAYQDSDPFLWHTQTYGVNPPTGPFEVDYVIAYGWWPLQCAVSSVDITSSYDEEKGLLKRPEPGTCNLVLKGDEGDPRVNAALRLDNKIRVMVDAAASPTNSTEYLFSGFLESVSTNYDTKGNAITNLNCIDAMSRVLNVNIPLYEYTNEESFGQRMYNVFEDYIAPATWGVSYDDSLWQLLQPYDRSVFPPEFRENVSSSEVINELTEGEYAVMAQSRAGVIFWWNRSAPAIFADSETLTSQPNWYGFSTEHHASSLDHFCISDFRITNSIEDVTNKVTSSLTYDELTTFTYTDQDSINIYGERAYDVQLNLDAPDEDPSFYLQRWSEEVPYSEDRPELESITTNVVNRLGYVTNAFLYDVNLDLMRIFIEVGPVSINGVWYARRIQHSITPDGWQMTLDVTSN